ncbi:hypothetical protein TNCV_2120871 [Trichonephila clavipes]|nr:hypothetical protein TNCV_2120871 [Trichonephila clavipes]
MVVITLGFYWIGLGFESLIRHGKEVGLSPEMHSRVSNGKQHNPVHHNVSHGSLHRSKHQTHITKRREGLQHKHPCLTQDSKPDLRHRTTVRVTNHYTGGVTRLPLAYV